MINKCYICNATNLQSEAKHTEVSQFGVSSCVTNASRKGGFVAKLIRGIRSLFVHTKRKTCYTMLQTNKQATKAKNSNLSHKFYTIVIGTLSAVAFPLLIAEADSTAILLLTKVAGVVCLLLANRLFRKIDNPNDYKEEYYERN